jgi:hypothetical protein
MCGRAKLQSLISVAMSSCRSSTAISYEEYFLHGDWVQYNTEIMRMFNKARDVLVDQTLAHRPGTYRLPGWNIAARTLLFYGRTHVLELLVVGISLNSVE